MKQSVIDSCEEMLTFLEEIDSNLDDNAVEPFEVVEMPAFAFRRVHECYVMLYHNVFSKSKLQ